MAALVAQSLPPSKVVQVLNTVATVAGTVVKDLTIDSDTVLFSIYVDSIAGGGMLDVVVDTLGGVESHTLRVITFPTVTSASTELLIRKAAATLDRLRVTATYTAACTFEVRAKAITAGETTTKILGATTARASHTTISTSPAVIIASSLTDRSGMGISNNNSNGTLYVGFSMAEAATGNGWPIGPGGALTLDLDAGVAVWGIGDSTIDVRLLEGGA